MPRRLAVGKGDALLFVSAAGAAETAAGAAHCCARHERCAGSVGWPRDGSPAGPAWSRCDCNTADHDHSGGRSGWHAGTGHRKTSAGCHGARGRKWLLLAAKGLDRRNQPCDVPRRETRSVYLVAVPTLAQRQRPLAWASFLYSAVKKRVAPGSGEVKEGNQREEELKPQGGRGEGTRRKRGRG